MIRTLFPPPTFDGLPPDATHGHSQFTSSKKPSVDSQHFNLLLPHTEIPLTLSTVVLPATSGHRFYFGNVSHSLPALLFCATLSVLLSVPSPALPCPRPVPLFSVRALSRSSLSAPSPTLPCPHLPLHLPVTFPCTSLSPSPAPPCHLPLHLPVDTPPPLQFRRCDSSARASNDDAHTPPRKQRRRPHAQVTMQHASCTSNGNGAATQRTCEQ